MATTTYSDPESGSEGEEEYDHGEESESDSEGEPMGFLDISAEVDDGESDGEKDSEDEGFAFTASASHLFRPSTTAASLEPFDFKDLPTEIRHRIWEWFCPELRARSRLLEFRLVRRPTGVMDFDEPQTWILQDDITLNDSTKALRTLLAVCQESRELALAKVPHALAFDAGPNGDAIVRFNRDKDVIALNGPSMADLAHGDELLLGNFREEVRSFSFPGWKSKDEFDHGGLAYLIRQFTQVDSVFGCMSSGDCRKNQLGWCKSDLVNRQYIQTFEKEPGLGEDLEFYFCWADQRNHPDFAKFQIPSELIGTIPRPIAQACQEKNVTMYPMVVFELESGIRKYNSLPQFNSAECNDDDDDESEEESEEGTDLDEYESDGIDDDPIPELGSDEDDEISIDGEEDGQSATQHSEARFSSPEPDPISRRRKRAPELDSDDSGEADADAPVVKRVRRNRVIDSDDEDEGEGAEPVKQVMVIDEDEDEEDEDGDEDGDEDQGDDDEDESESETEEEPRQLSLAERLNTHRRNNPIEDDEESNDEEDEDDDEEGDDSEPQSENELLDDMAEESGDEDELPEDPFYDPI